MRAPEPLVGLSLSFCIMDIVEGRVSLDQVERIIAGTCARTAEDWDHVVGVYRLAYWGKDPDRAERIARTMIKLGKVDQPRTRGEAPPRARLRDVAEVPGWQGARWASAARIAAEGG